MSAHTRLSLMVLWDDLERTHEQRQFDSVEDLMAGMRDVLKGEDLSRSGVASLTIAPAEPRTVRREPVWRRALTRPFANGSAEAVRSAT